jgi:ATP-dependent helicase/nuclease subunit B
MTEGSLNVFTIAGDRPFLDTLAAGIAARYGGTPLGLAAITVILPTRRACRGLQEAFLRLFGGKATLLPRLSALGDLDADELDLTLGEDGAAALAVAPAWPPLHRRLLLTQLVLRWGQATGHGPILPAQAAVLARDLARLLDEVGTARLDFAGLANIVPEELAEHWQITREFLRIATDVWPTLLAAHDVLDPAERRNRLIAGQLAAWRAHPPQAPVIAAGFAAASPAAADLLTFLAHDANGALVLPGVDTRADDELWAAIGGDPTHPQHGLHQLLTAIGTTHEVLEPWYPADDRAISGRVGLVGEVLRPAAVSETWTALPAFDPACLAGIRRVDCPGAQEEAGVIALLLRRQLEAPGTTAMLVTPDRGLARRVAAELRRWDIEIDDSAGTPLNLTPPGVFLRLLAQAAAEQLVPVPLLALLKHPLAGLGYETAALRGLLRRYEIEALRGPRPAPGTAGLDGSAGADLPADIGALLSRLAALLEPFLSLLAQPKLALGEALTVHLRVAEALAETPDHPGPERLWDAEAGAALADLMTELLAAAENLEPIAGADYPALLETLLAGSVVRPRFGRHPRLQILGTLEARLQHADLMVLGGLNEGVWPAEPGQDPWMSRPMRAAFGLPPSDLQIGLAAHDFASGLMAREVVLTRASRVDGAPTVPSRWLLRFETVLAAAGLDLPADLPVLAWQAALDRPDTFLRLGPPEPRPPVAARPTTLSVTEIETWRRDPYAIYARHILHLEALDPIDQDPSVADRGSFIHRALDAFIRLEPRPTPANALAALLGCGRTAFGETLAQPGVWAFWWPRFERIARWFLAWEAGRAAFVATSLSERRGRLTLTPLDRPFVLRARADRIDRHRDGSLAIIDYKTGSVPTPKEVQLGYAPQLPLEAAIAAAGGFDDIAGAPVSDLLYLRLSGGDPAGSEIRAGGRDGEPGALAAAAIAGLERLIVSYADPTTPYLAQPEPERAPRYGDYAHLARLAEWGGGSGE